LTSSLQNLISAATGMNLTTVDDPIQRKFLPSFLRGVAEENKLVTSPNFVVTQALVALLADKGARLRPTYDKTDVEKRGVWSGRRPRRIKTSDVLIIIVNIINILSFIL